MSMPKSWRCVLTTSCVLLLLTAGGYGQGRRPPTRLLTGPRKGAPSAIALDYIRQHQAQVTAKRGLSAQAAADATVALVEKSGYVSKHNGVAHFHYRQHVGGIEVFKGDINIYVSGEGRVINMRDRTVPGGDGLINASVPALSSMDAIAAAAAHLGLTARQPKLLEAQSSKASRDTLYDGADISLDPIPAKLMYAKREAGVLRLVWNLVLFLHDGEHWWELNVDAETGEVLSKGNWIQNAEYKVYELPLLNPDDGSRTTVTNPADTVASPYGWHDTDGVAGAEFTDTRGNNVYAQEDTDGNNIGGFRPDGGAGLVFDFPVDLLQEPSAYQSAAIANLFYWNNLCHDIHYQYGFDEASGNFQQNNYGNGGAAADPVQADAQDGSGMNNANFGTPPDGSAPRMQMFLWNMTSPMRDGDFDNIIIVHEYGHGVSTRLVGGPSDVTGLWGFQSGGMGEGWSDWWGLVFTAKPGETGADARGVGTYALGQPLSGVGIRHYPYSTNMAVNPLTFGDLPTAYPSVHYAGEIWCSALWDMYWFLVDSHGFDPDLYNGTGGNNIAMQLIMDGLKLTPSDPTFLDARDAILQADVATYGGSHQGEIWRAFARRGMGPLAQDGGNHNSTAVVESFELSGAMISPDSAYVAVGSPGVEPYLPSNMVYTVLNLSTGAANWQVTNSVPWLSVTPSSALIPGLSSTGFVVSLEQNVATGMAEGVYSDTLVFENLTDGAGNTTRDAILRIGSNYVMRSTGFAWIDPMTEGHTELALGGGGSLADAMPFDFTFYGVSYDTFYVSSRGLIGFVDEEMYPDDNADMPSTNPPNAIICPFWDALTVEADSSVYVGTEGLPPDRRHVVTWLSVGHATNGAPRFSFQVIVHEADGVPPENDLVFQYLDVASEDGNLGGGRSATIGIEDSFGTMARWYSSSGTALVSDGQALLFTMNQSDPDTNAPAARISVSSHSPTNVRFAVQFDEVVTGLGLGDFVLGGTWPGAALGTLEGSGEDYEVNVTGGIGLGSVELSLNAAAVSDLAGNPNAAVGPEIYVAPLSRTVFFDDLEANAERWTASEGTYPWVTLDGWEWGVPTYVWGPPSTPSGSNCWGTMLATDYPSDMNGWVESASIPVGPHPVLQFERWQWIETGYDYGYVEVHDGISWRNVTPGGAYSDFHPAWVSEYIELDSAEFGNRDIQVRFRLESDTYLEFSGFYVDDVRIMENRSPGIWVMAYAPSNAAPSSSEPLVIQAYNATTTTWHNVRADVASISAGLSVTGGTTVTYGDMAPGASVTGTVLTAVFGAVGDFSGSPVYLSHVVTADEGFVGEEQLPITITGVSVPGGANRLTARSVPGVVDWLGDPVQGDGGPDSGRFQVISAGTDVTADPPGAGGAVTGDDALLFAFDDLLPFGRFGEGGTTPPDLGRFDKAFTHGLSTGDVVYVRAWDGPGYGSSVAYGDSSLFALMGSAMETRDFGTWIVGTPIDLVRDLNGDSIPDGWDVLMGNDARLPLGPLSSNVTMESAYAGLYEPGRVVATSNFVFVADTRNHRILVLSPDLSSVLDMYGSYGTGTGEFSNPQGLDFYPDASRLVVADTRNYRVVLLAVDPLTGALSYHDTFGSRGDGAGEFEVPYAVAVVPDSGQILVADSDFIGVSGANHRVQRFGSDGTWQTTIGSEGTHATQFHHPLGISVGASNRVYVADAGNHRVKSMDLDGSSIWVFGEQGAGHGQFEGPRDVREGQWGWLCVADTENSRLVVLDARGAPGVVRYVGAYGVQGGGDGEFRYPQGVFPTTNAGPIYVADTLNHRVQQVSILVDGDGDGMDDLWEARMGLDPTDPTDWADDPDGDGVINIGEYRVGTDPFDSDSNGNGGSDGFELGLGRDPLEVPGYDLLIIRDVAATSPAVDFNVLSGGVYQVETRTNLLSGSWSDLGGPVTGGADGVMSVTVPAHADPSQFYRIKKTN